jgi:hypothetical protein
MPDFELEFWRHFLAREPSPHEKLEHAIATLNAWYANAHKGKGRRDLEPSDFMVYRDVWLTPEQRLERRMEGVKQALGGGTVKRKRKTAEE